MKVLVCGGAGYIGSHAVLRLLNGGHEVVAADSLERGHRQAVNKSAKLIVGDLRNADFAAKLLKDEKPEAVLNFAAYHLVGESVAEPLMYYENNMLGSLNLLKAMRAADCGALVFSSTAATYGRPETIPVTEEAATSPINPYGETKLAIEKMLKWADNAHGIKSACLRYFNVAGADKSGEIGEDHRPETHIIPNVLRAIKSGSAFKLFGNDYNTHDGTCVRDYIHVSDLIEAHVMALDALFERKESLLYNLGSKSGYSNLEIMKAAERVTGEKLNFSYEPRRPGDPDTLVASSDKIKRELGFETKLGLDEMIEDAWRFMNRFPDGYKD